MAEAYRTALPIFPKQSGFQPTVEPTGFQPVVAQSNGMTLIRSYMSLYNRNNRPCGSRVRQARVGLIDRSIEQSRYARRWCTTGARNATFGSDDKATHSAAVEPN
jgi:hypothetical protein